MVPRNKQLENRGSKASTSGMTLFSGFAKGLKIEIPEGLETRPTRSRVRSAAINMIQTSIEGATIADVFAGSGAVGIELLSRGAAAATFVESNSRALKVLQDNCKKLLLRATQNHVSIASQVKDMDASDFVRSCQVQSFDIVWADPPYMDAHQFLNICLPLMRTILRSQGVFIFESSSEGTSSVLKVCDENGWQPWKQRQYGASLITIWRQ